MAGMFQSPDDLRRGSKRVAPKATPGKKGFQKASEPPPDPNEVVRVHVRTPQKVNGQWYAGWIEVPRALANILSDQDTRADAERANFVRADKAVVIGGRPGRHTAVEVGQDFFDGFEGMIADGGRAAPVIDRVSGKGMTDPGVRSGATQF